MPRVLVVPPAPLDDLGSRGLVDAVVESLPDWETHVCAWSAAAAALRHASGVVVAGGVPFPPPARTVTSVFAAARIFGRPIALVGVGAPMLAGRDARHAARVARACDLLVVRDEVSAAALCAAGVRPPVRIGSDPTWTLLDRRPPPPPSPTTPVLVAGDQPALVAGLVADLDGLGVDGRVLPWGRAIAGRAEDRAMVQPAGLAAARDALTRAGVAVVTRLHAAIAAASAGVPAVAVGHDRGLEALARRLGQPWIAPGRGAAALADAMAVASAAGAPPASAIKSEVARAEEAFRLLRVLLSGGATDEVEALVGLPLGPVPWLR